MKPFLVLLILFFSFASHASDNYKDKGEVSFSESEVTLDSSFGSQAGEKSTLQESRLVNYLATEGYIFKVSIHEKIYSGENVGRCEMVINSSKKNSSGKYIKGWKLSNNDCSAKIENGYFIKTKQDGCCGAEDAFSYYSLKDGAFVSEGTGEPFAIPNTGGLFIIYFGDQGVTFNKSDKTLNGEIYLVNDKKVLDKIYVKNIKGPTWTPEIKMSPADDYQQKEKLITLTFEGDNEKYDLIVKNSIFEIPKSSAGVFKK